MLLRPRLLLLFVNVHMKSVAYFAAGCGRTHLTDTFVESRGLQDVFRTLPFTPSIPDTLMGAEVCLTIDGFRALRA